MIRTKPPTNAKQARKKARARKVVMNATRIKKMVQETFLEMMEEYAANGMVENEIQITPAPIKLALEHLSIHEKLQTVRNYVYEKYNVKNMPYDELMDIPDIYINLNTGEIREIRTGEYGRWFYWVHVLPLEHLDRARLLLLCEGPEDVDWEDWEDWEEWAEDIVLHDLLEKGIIGIKKEDIIFPSGLFT